LNQRVLCPSINRGAARKKTKCQEGRYQMGCFHVCHDQITPQPDAYNKKALDANGMIEKPTEI